MKKGRVRISLGLSVGDTVPLWGSNYRSFGGRGLRSRWFYCWINSPNGHSYGGAGFKFIFIYARVVWGRKFK